MAQLRGARERMAAAGARARQFVAEIGGELSHRVSGDGLAKVTCDGLGNVRNVAFDKARYNRASERQLCQAVVQARNAARRLAITTAARTSLAKSGPSSTRGAAK